MTSPNRLAAALGLAAALSLNGCAVIAYLTAQIHGPEKIEAKFDLPKDKTTLVLVDSYGSHEMAKRLLTEAVSKQLCDRGLVKKTIPYNDIIALRMITPEFNRLAVTEIGRKLGAETVICVHISKLALKDNPADVLWHGQMEARVKVVAVTDDNDSARLWPDDRPAGYPIGPIERRESTDNSLTYASQLTKSLSLEAADELTRLFYKHDRTGIHAYGDRPTDTEALTQ